MRVILFYFDNKVNRIFTEKTDENGDKFVTLSSPYNFVDRDEIVCRVVNIDNEEDIKQHLDKGYTYYNIEKYSAFKPSDGVYHDQFANCYRASEYGFVIYDRVRSHIRLLSPLQFTKDRVHGYFFLFPTKFSQLPTYKDMETILQRSGVLTILDKSLIEESIAKLDPGKPKPTRVLVAQGKEPVNGYAEYYLPMVSIDKKAGKMMHDGRIDFREVDSVVQIYKGQEVLQRFPEVKPVNGMDVFGEQIDAVIESRDGYIKGDNIVPSEHDPNIYLAGVDGCLDIDGKKISVLPYAKIKGNVDYDSGNIDFQGSVHVLGSVMPGFVVKAKGDIVVENLVDDAVLEAEGDVYVRVGITGKGSSKISAGGKVKTNYILNSQVEAVREVEVEDSIINSIVFSNDRISVYGKHGKIIGGKVTARHEIKVNTAGSMQENKTELTVGRSLFIEREILEIRKEMDIVRSGVDEIIMKIKASFGDGLFENPKEFVAILPAVKKKNCLILLKELSERNKVLKELSEKRNEVENKLKLEEEPRILITDNVFPGTVIFIKRRRRMIDQKLQNVKFFEDPEHKVVTFSQVV